MGRSLKSAGASSRASRIFTTTVSPTGNIKPENLVVDWDFCLKIIDFDVAMKVNDEDEVVDDQLNAGRRVGWRREGEVDVQPDQGRPVVNRASSSYLLNKFRKEDTVLRTTARKLTAHNPERRPSMLQVTASLPDVANVAVEKKASRIAISGGHHGSRRRKREAPEGEEAETFNTQQDGDERSSSVTCGSRSMIFSCSWCSVQ